MKVDIEVAKNLPLDEYGELMLKIKKYDVNIDSGIVCNLERGKPLKSTLDSNGYPVVKLSLSRGCARSIHVHRLIAIKVWGVSTIKGKQVGHKNGVRHESVISNLWLPETVKEHVYHDETWKNLNWSSDSKVKKYWEPCVDCGEKDGRIEGSNKTPDRLNGIRFGIEGKICRRCYRKHSERVYRKRRAEGR